MSINLFGKRAGLGGEDDDDADKLDIPIHAFDLIIADECHRGYPAKELSVWRDTLNYFDAIRIGLTARLVSRDGVLPAGRRGRT